MLTVAAGPRGGARRRARRAGRRGRGHRRGRGGRGDATLKIADAGRAAPAGRRRRPARACAARSTRCARSCPRARVWAPDVVECPRASCARRCTGRCATWCWSPTSAAAARLVAGNPELRAVTPDGDVLGAYAAAGGSGKATSYIEVQAAVEEARGQPGHRRADRSPSSRTSWSRPGPRWPSTRRRCSVAAAAKRAAEGERNAAARRLAELGAAARSAKAETDRLGAVPAEGRGGPRGAT